MHRFRILTALIFCGMLLCSFRAGAQVVLRPEVTGYASREHSSLHWAGSPDIAVGYEDYSTYYGLLEFDVQDIEAISGITTNNFKAELFHLSVTYAYIEDALRIRLYDMEDQCEDAEINIEDLACISDFIASRRMTCDPPVPASFNKIDVTQQVRHDLFGTTNTGVTTGFVLAADGSAIFTGIADFNHVAPRLAVWIKGYDAGTDASLDSGVDAAVDIECRPSTDVDTDVDVDSDSDADADSDAGASVDADADADNADDDGGTGDGGINAEDGGGDCGCMYAGRESTGGILTLIRLLLLSPWCQTPLNTYDSG